MKELLICSLLTFTKRLVFDIYWQDPSVTYNGEDDGDYFKFIASNGYEVISRSRMDIQTERIWLLGSNSDTIEGSRSGTMVFSDNEKRDKAHDEFRRALGEWAEANGGYVTFFFD